MANKQALRALQTRLAERMQQVRTEEAGVSWLAVQCAGAGLLLQLRQAGEIFDLSTVLPVPHALPWLSGVVNLRGGVCTVVDLAAFLGLSAPGASPVGAAARLVAFNAALGINSALKVDRLEGLRHAADMQREDETDDNRDRPAFAAGRWRDAAGRVWQEIDLVALSRQPEFLAIAG
jgi:twitching motility protein PilI